MYTYILFFIIMLYLMLVLYFTGGDYFHPCAIILEVYLASMILLIMEIKKWDAYLNEKTFWIIVLGLSVYVLTATLTFAKRKPPLEEKMRKADFSNDFRRRTADVDGKIVVILDISAILFLFFYYRDIKESSLTISTAGSIGEMIGNFHEGAVGGTLEVGLSTISHYGLIILTAIAYVLLYIVVLNIVLKKKNTLEWKVSRWLIIIVYLAVTVLSGSRNPILQMVIAGIMIYFMLNRKFYEHSRHFRMKFAIQVLLIGAIVLFLFSSFRGLVGRTSEYGFIDYVAKYMGAPIKLFDMFVVSGNHNVTGIWGKETFVNVWKFIGQRNGDQVLSMLVMNKEWRNINGFSLGNVYTAFREYYFDFGIFGIAILTAIHSLLFTSSYRRINSERHRTVENKVDLSILLYAYFAQSLVYFSIDDRLFQAYLSYNNIITIIIICFFSYVLPKVVLHSNGAYDGSNRYTDSKRL